MDVIKSYDDWCKINNCEHGHCPYNCEHPQPFVFDGKLYCGRCRVHGEKTEMVPCDDKVC